MKDLQTDKRALNTALIYAKTRVDGCENACLYIVKDESRYIVLKKSENYLYKVEFKQGKINVVDPKKEERKAKKAKKLPSKLQDAADGKNG